MKIIKVSAVILIFSPLSQEASAADFSCPDNPGIQWHHTGTNEWIAMVNPPWYSDATISQSIPPQGTKFVLSSLNPSKEHQTWYFKCTYLITNSTHYQTTYIARVLPFNSCLKDKKIERTIHCN